MSHSKHIFEENLYYSLFGNTFQWNSYHVKTSKMIALQTNLPISIWYDYLLKGASEKALITATVISCKIILVQCNLNSTNQGH